MDRKSFSFKTKLLQRESNNAKTKNPTEQW
jgi:hypothetical protein